MPRMNTEHLFLRALARQPVERTPVWLMRQAGRYLPEYRATRAKAGDFLSLCANAELACEVTLQPLERYPLDAAILFSDILTVPDAMGLGLHFIEGEGPCFHNPVDTPEAIRALGVPDPEDELGYVMNAVRTIHNALDGRVPLIGFAGSPWTLAVYMVEGRATREFRKVKALMNADPQSATLLLDTVAQSVALYLEAQVRAGAQALMIFDTWGGVLAHSDYEQYSLRWMRQIVKSLKASCPHTPILLFTKGGGQWLDAMADSGCDGLGIDWTTSLDDARREVGDRVALQGNLDPAVLHGPAERIDSEVKRIIAEFGPHPGHIFNLGHGIQTLTDPDNVTVMVEAVARYSAR